MRRCYRASRIYPLCLLALTGLMFYFFFENLNADKLGRVVLALTFVGATTAEAILLLIHTELVLDDTGFIYRKQSFCGSGLRTIPLSDIERIRVKGRFVRLKLTDDEVVMLKLGILSRSDRKEAQAWFRKLPQNIDDPYAEARDSRATKPTA